MGVDAYVCETVSGRPRDEHGLGDVAEYAVDGRPFVSSDYVLDGRASHLVSTLARVDELVPGSALVNALAEQVADQPEGHEGVVDLYLDWPQAPADPDYFYVG